MLTPGTGPYARCHKSNECASPDTSTWLLLRGLEAYILGREALNALLPVFRNESKQCSQHSFAHMGCLSFVRVAVLVAVHAARRATFSAVQV